VSSNYFDVMKIPLRAGRMFRDEGETEKVAVVSELRPAGCGLGSIRSEND
jgi:hypothetical protein